MSTGSISTSNSSASQTLYQYYQTLNQSSVASSNSASGTSTQSADTDNDNDSSQTVQPHPHRHHGGGGGGGGGGLISQLQQAVSTALDANQASGSTTDPNQVIQTAIQGVLGGTTSSTSSTSGSTSTDSSSSTDGSSSTGQSFAQLLQSNGVSPQQFEQDLLSALQNSPNAQVPPGSLVDVQA